MTELQHACLARSPRRHMLMFSHSPRYGLILLVPFSLTKFLPSEYRLILLSLLLVPTFLSSSSVAGESNTV